MNTSVPLYQSSLALLTDLYQLTLAYGCWKRASPQEAVFHLHFRTTPFGGGYTVAAGLGYVVDLVERFRFDADDVAYLATLQGGNERPLFEPGFLDALASLKLTVDIDAVPEGSVVFPLEPLVRVQGPLMQCQLLETALLNVVNFQTLIATKSERVCDAAQGEPVLEFGVRRAQGLDGALAASRAAYIGGCAATSNVLAGRVFNIPVRGTHAHSWVMSFEHELDAFRAYAEAMPNNCVFLVDTYDTLQGVRHAVEVGRWLRERGHTLAGVRLDSGDLAYLSIEARKILDEGGFPEASIVASNDLDERLIASLKAQGARISVWGVGTKLVTAYDQPALGGVYKLAAMRTGDGPWQHRIKVSEQAAKTSTPGIQQVRRYSRNGVFRADMIYDTLTDLPAEPTMVDPHDPTRRRSFDGTWDHTDLLVPVFRHGRRVYDPPSLATSRAHARTQLDALHPTLRRFDHPHAYPVGMERGLYDLRTQLVLRARGLDG